MLSLVFIVSDESYVLWKLKWWQSLYWQLRVWRFIQSFMNMRDRFSNIIWKLEEWYWFRDKAVLTFSCYYVMNVSDRKWDEEKEYWGGKRVESCQYDRIGANEFTARREFRSIEICYFSVINNRKLQLHSVAQWLHKTIALSQIIICYSCHD